MKKEQLIEYVNLYNQFQNNPNMQFTIEQLNLIKEVHADAQTNIDLANFLSKTQISSETERISALNEYLKEQEIKTQNQYKINELISVDHHLYEKSLEDITKQNTLESEQLSQETKQEEQRNLQDLPKQKVLKKNDKKAGFADVLLLSLITGFLGGTLTTLATLLLTK